MTSATGSNPRGLLFASRRGLTLIEILISVAILASAVVFIMQALARGAYALSLGSNQMRAYTFASAKMADLEVALSQEAAIDEEGSTPSSRDQFRWRVAMSPVDDEPQLQLVTLTIEWNQGPRVYASSYSLMRRLPEVTP